MIRKPYPPGKKKKGRFRAVSEYGKELREKQKLKKWYNLRERQFQNYVKQILEKRGKVDPSNQLIKILETRLDNVVFKLGFSSSRTQARQLVSHGHFLINGKPVNIPSYSLRKGDKITIRPGSQKKKIFQNLQNTLKKHTVPDWLELNPGKLEGKVIGLPTSESANLPVEISAIFEYYSR